MPNVDVDLITLPERRLTHPLDVLELYHLFVVGDPDDESDSGKVTTLHAIVQGMLNKGTIAIPGLGTMKIGEALLYLFNGVFVNPAVSFFDLQSWRVGESVFHSSELEVGDEPEFLLVSVSLTKELGFKLCQSNSSDPSDIIHFQEDPVQSIELELDYTREGLRIGWDAPYIYVRDLIDGGEEIPGLAFQKRIDFHFRVFWGRVFGLVQDIDLVFYNFIHGTEYTSPEEMGLLLLIKELGGEDLTYETFDETCMRRVTSARGNWYYSLFDMSYLWFAYPIKVDGVPVSLGVNLDNIIIGTIATNNFEIVDTDYEVSNGVVVTYRLLILRDPTVGPTTMIIGG